MANQRDTFTRRQVERSFRKFQDIVDDILSASFQTWSDTFSHLITHCETDPVMQIITGPLKSDPRIDAGKWWDDAVSSPTGMVGSGHYTLPTDDDERTALLYQVFLKIEFDDLDIKKFCVAGYGHTHYQEMVSSFNQELVTKFTREVSYRLDEIAEDTADQPEISREAMIVFHHHDYSTNISGSIHGSNIATGNAQVSHSSAQFNTPADVAAELLALKSLASEFSRDQQATITTALDFLASASESDSAEANEVAEHVQTVAELSPTIATRLRRLVAGTSSSLAASAIVEGIKAVLGG